MKAPATLIGGRLIDDPRIYQTYALYFVKFIQAYQRAGVPIYAVHAAERAAEPQAERVPRHGHAGRPGGQAHQRARPGAAAGRAATPSCSATTNNWSEHPNDIANTPPARIRMVDYPFDLLDTSAGRWLAGTAFHCYAGDQARQTPLHNAFPDKEIWFTECSGSHGPTDPPAQVFSDTLKWHARNSRPRCHPELGPDDGQLEPRPRPRPVARTTAAAAPAAACSPSAPGQTVSRDAEYYTLGHLARFCPSGRDADRQHVVRHHGLERADHGRRVSATRTARPRSSCTTRTTTPRSLAVAVGDASFDYTLPGGALATFTWPASRALRQPVAPAALPTP